MHQLLVGGDEPRSIQADVGFTALRVAIGLMMAFGHGLAKVPPPAGFVEGVANLGFPLPAVFAWAAGLSPPGLFTEASGFSRHHENLFVEHGLITPSERARTTSPPP